MQKYFLPFKEPQSYNVCYLPSSVQIPPPPQNSIILCIKFNEFALFLKISFLKNVVILTRAKPHYEPNFAFSPPPVQIVSEGQHPGSS